VPQKVDGRGGLSKEGEPPMKNVDRLFILTGLLFLLVGMALGLKMNMEHDFTLHGLHAHLNLLGFVVMTLFGLCYHAWPKMKEGMLPFVHYVLHTVTVASSLSILYFVLSDEPTYGPTLGPIVGYILMVTWASVALFAFLFITRAKD
jgi:hypothetical protein